MDSQIAIKGALLAVLFIFSGCATLPPQDFKYSLNAGSPNESQWFRAGLASSGHLSFKFRLRELGTDAADVHIAFGNADKQNPLLRISFSDKRCVGAYSIAINYRVHAREWRTIYPTVRPLWGNDTTLSIKWGSDKAVISIDNAAPYTVDVADALKSIRVEVQKGGIDVDELVYRTTQS